LHFKLFEKGFTLSEAIEEAKRCLTCGPCVSCKACISVGIQDHLPMVDVNPERCSGCGICVSVCYYSAAQTREVENKRVSMTDMFRCKSCGMCVVACPSKARMLVGDPMEEELAAVFKSLRS
jgi:heterodisulfide reductase subunit A-like polyferredoxin